MSSDNAIGSANLHLAEGALNKSNTIQSVNAISAVDDERQALPQSNKTEQTETAILSQDKGAASPEEVSKAVAHLSEVMQKFGHTVEFSVDKDTKETIILVKDHNTDEVVRQIPTAEALELSKRLEQPQIINRQGLSPVTTPFLVDEEI